LGQSPTTDYYGKLIVINAPPMRIHNTPHTKFQQIPAELF